MHLPLPARVLSKLIQVIGYVSSSRDDIFEVAASQMLELFDVDACLFGISEPGGMRVVAATSKTPEIADTLIGRSIDKPCPAFSDGLLMSVEDAEKEVGCSQGLACNGGRSYLCLPLTIRGERMGVMSVASKSSHPFSLEEIDLYLAVASLVAISVQNTELYRNADDMARELRRQVDEKTRALRALNSFTERVNSATSRDQLFAVVKDNIARVVPCNSASLALCDHAEAVRVFTVRGDCSEIEQGETIPIAETVLGDLGRSGKARVQHGPPIPRAKRLIGSGADSYCIVPMITANKLMGSFNVSRSESPSLSHSELPILTQIANQLAAALARIEVYEHERTIAQRFQESLQPATVYTKGWLSVASRYEAALSEADVGGDFCDIIEIDEDRIGIAVGDISGKGLAAAIRAAEMKYMLQAYAIENPAPDVVLERLNRAISRSFNEIFATLFYGVIDLREERFTYANGGHEPPALIKPGSPIEALDVTGPALAVFSDAAYDSRMIQIGPDYTILCYTDGITEARCSRELWGYERLVEALVACPSKEPLAIVDYIYQKANEFASGHLSDDVALVAISRVTT